MTAAGSFLSGMHFRLTDLIFIKTLNMLKGTLFAFCQGNVFFRFYIFVKNGKSNKALKKLFI